MKKLILLIGLIGSAFLFLFNTNISPQTTLSAEEKAIARKVDSLLVLMTLEEKIGQTTLFTSDRDNTGPSIRGSYRSDIRVGKVGAVFNAYSATFTRELQRIAVEDTRLGIPLLFGYDVVHGFKTIFPIPLAESCSWDLEAMERSARIAAEEATAAGLHWTFAPMIDVSRDPRWGRVAECGGEDTYLNTQIAIAKVKGFQGDDIESPNTLLACPKHFVAYGAAQAGRDYHTVDISQRTLWETYLPPFKAAIDAGAYSIMTSFNEINGVPATGNDYLLNEVLKNQWDFDGMVVTDYTSINEMVPHGIVANLEEAGEMAINAGVDMDMQGAVFNEHLEHLIAENRVSEKTLDQAVKRILRLKFKLGLFDDPFLYSNEQREKEVVLSKSNRDFAKEMAQKSMVLLKNENNTLPLSKETTRLALIGPLVGDTLNPLGNWRGAGESNTVVSVLEGIKNKLGNEVQITHAKGCDFETEIKNGFSQAIQAVKNAEIIIAVLGERENMSGEAASRSQIGLPRVQLELLKKLHQTGKPIVVVLMNGRPLTIPWMNENIPAILESWFPGIEAGNAIADIIFGDYNPSGKLSISFPQNVGQIPLYYCMKNTGRPKEEQNKYTSKYLDISNEPLFPFGYGLSYTTFEYSSIQTDKTTMGMNDTLTVQINVSNTGNYDGSEIIQLYIRDLVGSVTRPLKELKGFEKVLLRKGESRTIEFSITSNDLAFYGKDMTFKAEPGMFEIYIGENSETDNVINVELVDNL